MSTHEKEIIASGIIEPHVGRCVERLQQAGGRARTGARSYERAGESVRLDSNSIGASSRRAIICPAFSFCPGPRQALIFQESRYSENVNELAQEKYVPRIPETSFGTPLDYDPNTGEIKVVKP